MQKMEIERLIRQIDFEYIPVTLNDAINHSIDYLSTFYKLLLNDLDYAKMINYMGIVLIGRDRL